MKQPAYTFLSANPEAIEFKTDLLVITILGGVKITGLDRLRVTLKMEYAKEINPLNILRYNINLYQTDQTEKLIRKVSEQFDLKVMDVSITIASLIEALEKYRIQKLEEENLLKPQKKELSKQEEKEAREYLTRPRLMERTGADIGVSGVVGEELNRLLMYLIFTSRKRSHPLHVISLGQSGTGKTHLQEKVAELIPEEDKIEITSLSKNAFYYFEKDELAHRLLLIEDLDGAEEALYPLRELQSKRRITKTVTVKDSKGILRTKSYVVNGIVSIAGCTTKEKVYEDNQNRCFLIYIDSSKEQDVRIMEYQRKISSGEIDVKTEERVKQLFRNVQRVLKPVKVVNPYASRLRIPEEVFKPRRSMTLYLSFIEAVTFYHQFQRVVKVDKQSEHSYIETTIEDIRWANKLLKDVLLRKSDGLSGACRNFFEELKKHVEVNHLLHFYSKDIRQTMKVHSSSLKRYLQELEKEGYLKITGGTKYSGYEYSFVDLQEFQKLKQNIDSVLDDCLNNLLKKNPPKRLIKK